MLPEPVDLSIPAANGLRRGRTTGTCAAAAAKAAVWVALTGQPWRTVVVTLPDGGSLAVPIRRCQRQAEGLGYAEVVKDAGDDPDQTHGAVITCAVRIGGAADITFRAGPGVGAVTEPGLPIAVGEPAINPVPRRMIRQAVGEALAAAGAAASGGEVTVGCLGGERIAARTFNPRLGIRGGISILGTSGLVEPKSAAAFRDSIAACVAVALGDDPAEIALSPGNIGQRFAVEQLKLPLKRVVQMSNDIGFTLDTAEARLASRGHRLARLWLVGHPGKLAKILGDIWFTHSHHSVSALAPLADWAEAGGEDSGLVQRIRTANTVEEIIQHLGGTPWARGFWGRVAAVIEAKAAARLTQVQTVRTGLFSLQGELLHLL